MAVIRYTCPACARRLVAWDEYASRTGRCPACGARHAVPAQDLGVSPGPGGAEGPPPTRFPFSCEHCGQRLRVRPEDLGQQRRCPVCSRTFLVDPVVLEEETAAAPSGGEAQRRDVEGGATHGTGTQRGDASEPPSAGAEAGTRLRAPSAEVVVRRGGPLVPAGVVDPHPSTLEATSPDGVHAAAPGGPGLLVQLRRRWWVAAVTAVVISAGGLPLIWCLYKPLYTATGAIEVAPVLPRLLFKDESGTLPFYTSYVNTQAQLIMSTRILYDTLEDPAVRDLAYIKRCDDPLAELQKSLQAGAGRNSQLLYVSMTGTDPEAITAIVNAAVRAYMRKEGGSEERRDLDTRIMLERKRDDASKKLQDLQETLRELSQEVGTTEFGKREEIVLQRVQGLQAELTRVEAARIALQAQAQMLDKRQMPTSFPATLFRLQREFVQANPLVAALTTRVAQLQEAYALEVTKWAEDAPQLKRLEHALATLKRELEVRQGEAAKEFDQLMQKEQELQKTQAAEDIRYRFEQLQAHEARIRELLNKENEAAVALGRKGLAIKRLEVDMAFTQDLYQTLRQRIQVLEMESQRPGRVQVAYFAEVPRLPANDRRQKLSAVLVMGAVLAGCALAILFERLRMRVRGPADVQARCGMHVLGTTPRLKDLFRERIQPQHFMDDCQTIWVNLMLGEGNGQTRALVVTSPEAGEGKTVFAINLAKCIAFTGKRVLLVDGDLRKPDIARYGRLAAPRGLRSVLTEACSLEEAIQPTPVPTLDVLPGDGRMAQETQVLANGRIAAIMAELRTRYDEIVIDTPSSLATPDAILWASLSDGVVLVARSGRTGVKELREAQTRLKRAGVRLLGVVLAGVRLQDSYEKYHQRYGNGRAEMPYEGTELALATVFHLGRETGEDGPPASTRDDSQPPSTS